MSRRLTPSSSASHPLAALQEGSLPIFSDNLSDNLASAQSLCQRVKNLIHMIEDDSLKLQYFFVFDPIAAYLSKIGSEQWELLRNSLVPGNVKETLSHSICKDLSSLLEKVRLKKLNEVKLHSASIASIFRDDYIEELEKAVEQFAYYERRYMAKGAMIAYLQLSRDLKDLEGGEPGGMAIVRAISALNLSRMVFDYRSGSYNLYAVRINYERQRILSLLSKYRVPLQSVGFAAIRNGLDIFSSDSLPFSLQETYSWLQTGKDPVYQGVETRLRQVEKRLHDNINLASWDLLRKSRPSWDPSVSAATLINQVLIKIIHLKLNLRMQLLNESERAFFTIFHDAGFPHYVTSAPASVLNPASRVFVPENRLHAPQ